MTNFNPLSVLRRRPSPSRPRGRRRPILPDVVLAEFLAALRPDHHTRAAMGAASRASRVRPGTSSPHDDVAKSSPLRTPRISAPRSCSSSRKRHRRCPLRSTRRARLAARACHAAAGSGRPCRRRVLGHAGAGSGSSASGPRAVWGQISRKGHWPQARYEGRGEVPRAEGARPRGWASVAAASRRWGASRRPGRNPGTAAPRARAAGPAAQVGQRVDVQLQALLGPLRALSRSSTAPVLKSRIVARPASSTTRS